MKSSIVALMMAIASSTAATGEQRHRAIELAYAFQRADEMRAGSIRFMRVLA